MINEKCVGSSLDALLIEDGTYALATATAIKRVLAWQIEQAMRQGRLSKTQMAERMRTSRAALNRLLDPRNASVTLHTLDRAAQALGKHLKIDLVDEAVR